MRPGSPFSETDLEDARTRIYQMRVFSEVELVVGRKDPKTGASQFPGEREARKANGSPGRTTRPSPVGGAEDEPTDRVCRLPKNDSKHARVPIEIRVKPAKLYRLGFGAGLQIGVEDGQRAINATQQWDVHLVTYAEVRNFLGGLRRLRIEERPRLIFSRPSRALENSEGVRETPRFGNNLSTLLEWPAFLEARTLLRLTANWDRGPNPYGAKFVRDDIDIGLGPSRGFFKNRLNVALSIHFNPYIPAVRLRRAGPAGTRLERRPSSTAKSTSCSSFSRSCEWDTRDDQTSAHSGTLTRLEVHETLPPSQWFYIRLTPEVRHYFPLPYGLVFAARAGLGWNQTLRYVRRRRPDGATPAARPTSVSTPWWRPILGPRRASGSLRQTDETPALGFPGGTRSWIASVELRVPLGDSFGIATFIDVGDVNGGSATETPRFRFDRPNTTFGGGLRYKTIVGPIRLDVGWLVPGLQGNQTDRDKVQAHAIPCSNSRAPFSSRSERPSEHRCSALEISEATRMGRRESRAREQPGRARLASLGARVSRLRAPHPRRTARELAGRRGAHRQAWSRSTSGASWRQASRYSIRASARCCAPSASSST